MLNAATEKTILAGIIPLSISGAQAKVCDRKRCRTGNPRAATVLGFFDAYLELAFFKRCRPAKTHSVISLRERGEGEVLPELVFIGEKQQFQHDLLLFAPEKVEREENELRRQNCADDEPEDEIPRTAHRCGRGRRRVLRRI